MKVLVHVMDADLTYVTTLPVVVGDEVEVPAFHWQSGLSRPNVGIVVSLESDYPGKCVSILRIITVKPHPYGTFIEDLMMDARIPRGKTKLQRVQYMLGELDKAGLEMLTRHDLKVLVVEAWDAGYEVGLEDATRVSYEVGRQEGSGY
jgi:hypothetical protein